MDELSAWSTFATAVFTLGLLLAAWRAWRTARDTLLASQRASRAAEEANNQTKRDSREQTRPYVYVEVLPSLAGHSAFDLRIANSGRSAARSLTLEFSDWPNSLDDVAASVKELFETPRTLPPGCSLRVMWRLQGNFTDGTKLAGIPDDGHVIVRYTSDDPSEPKYRDRFDARVGRSGLWPVSEEGPVPEGVTGERLKFYRLGQALVRRMGEVSR